MTSPTPPPPPRRLPSEQQLERLRRRHQAALFTYERQQANFHLMPVQMPGFISEPGEEVFLAMPGKLLEWVKEPGHYETGGAFAGISVAIPGTDSARAMAGRTAQPRYVDGDEGWSRVDEGAAIITDRRIAFRGQRMFLEWRFDKLSGLEASEFHSAIGLQVTDRRAGNVVVVEDFPVFIVKLQLSLARARGEPAPTLEPPPHPPELEGETIEPAEVDDRQLEQDLKDEIRARLARLDRRIAKRRQARDERVMALRRQKATPVEINKVRSEADKQIDQLKEETYERVGELQEQLTGPGTAERPRVDHEMKSFTSGCLVVLAIIAGLVLLASWAYSALTS